jgi:hypothetical protein
VLGAEAMRSKARRLAGDPFALAAARRDAAVKRGRDFERDPGTAFPHAEEEPLVEGCGLLFQHAGPHLDAGGA